jgi:2-oxoglutarate dehydrogenase E2 component (dihydrolipoamide succinyltransferase)
MAADVRIPQLGESVNEGVIVRWLKDDGALVHADEPLLELETEKATMEIPAETSGRLRITQPVGARVSVGTVVGRIEEAQVSTPVLAKPAEPPARESSEPVTASAKPERATPSDTAAPPSDPPAAASTAGPGEAATPAPSAAPTTAAPPAPPAPTTTTSRPAPTDGGGDGAGRAAEPDVERVLMSELRRAIARRLVDAQRTAAILTTFNEIDCGELLALRKRHRERFRAKHGVDLGLMSLFSRAAVNALRDVRVVNARIDGNDIVYYRRVHLGIAVSTSRGLVVPVVRDADAMSLAGLERAIGAVVARAREGKLVPDDLSGGTFTITNGGVFGSLLSTPLLNPPQSGILGMHKIEERPVAAGGQVVIRPMMYVALSYDHRLVDGEQAVTFLVRVKEQLEDPARMVLEV